MRLMPYVLPWMLVAGSLCAEVLPIDITAERLDVRQKEGKARFDGHVVAKQGDLTLNADSLSTTYGKGTGGKMEQIVATGHVVLTRGTEERATGDVATYDLNGKTLVLKGLPVTLTRGASQLEGDRLTYDMATGNAKVTRSGGAVKARFVPAGGGAGVPAGQAQ